MKKKNGSILLFVLVCIGILGTMLITFLCIIIPKEVFYGSAVRSYGFYLRNLHGLLELEAESVKNLTLAQLRDKTDLMFPSYPFTWNEDKLNELRKTLNKFPKEYWKNTGESFIEKPWDIAKEAESKVSHDRTRRMYQDASATCGLFEWYSCKNHEEALTQTILKIFSDATKGDLSDENILELLENLKNVNSQCTNDEWKAAAIKETQEILNGMLKNEHPGWQNVGYIRNQMDHWGHFLRRVNQTLKQPQEERLRELVSLKIIEQNLDGKESIDANTWLEIKRLLNIEKSLEKSLPQEERDKKDFLKELEALEQKFLSSNGQTQPKTFDEVSRIRTEISKIFQKSIEDALGKRISDNGSSNDKYYSQAIRDLKNDIETLINTDPFLKLNLRNILNPTNNKNLIDKLKSLARGYTHRVGDNNYKEFKKLAGEAFLETLTLTNDMNRLQSVFATVYTAKKPSWTISTADHKRNFNVENTVVANMLDNKLPLTVKFKNEVKEVIKLIFQSYGIDEREIVPFLDDLEGIIDVLGKPDSIQPGLKELELEYFRAIIEDFRDTKHDLGVSIFKEFSSWKAIFQGKNSHVENNILHDLGNSLTFVNGIDSINFYAASGYVRQALVYSLPLRPEISSQQKKEAKLPESGDPKTIRQEMQNIFNYGLKEGNNDQAKLEENKKTIRKILKLLHEAKLANFPENQDEEIDVYHSYSRCVRIAVKVWDKDYQSPLHRTTNYDCRIEYVGNGKLINNTVQRVEEF